MSTSDKDFLQLSISVGKALNPSETPLKLKHARSTIISIHQTKEAKTFWSVITKQPLMDNRFTAWKFCHLIHKVLREGPSCAIRHSQSHKKVIYEIGKLWGHLRDGVGICIQAYTKLLVTKLEFHEKNPHFPGSLLIDFSNLEKVAEGDINFYFQLGVEVFDYLDDIIELQEKVFSSIKTYRMSSMTPQGQCRLAPLIPLIQDSNPLYDLAVRLMFKLHTNLPNDILSGHRTRFQTLFNQLKDFYYAVRPLQYFADLIQVPHLPNNAPNFSSSVDFGSYIPPIVVVPPEPEPLVNVDSDQVQSNQEDDTDTLHIDLEQLLQDRDHLIRELQFEIERLRSSLKASSTKYKGEMQSLEEQVIQLNSQLASTREELINMRTVKEDLEMQVQNTPTLKQKATAEEERANASEEKFTKLKNMYTQIRDEHISLLRQHADITKQLSSVKNKNTELLAESEIIKDQLIDKERDSKAIVNRVLELERQNQDQNTKYEDLMEKHTALQKKYDNMQAEKLTLIAELKLKANLLQNEVHELKLEIKMKLENMRHELDSQWQKCTMFCKELEQSLHEKTKIVNDLNQNVSNSEYQNVQISKELHSVKSAYEALKSTNEALELKNKKCISEFEEKMKGLHERISHDNEKFDETTKALQSQFYEQIENERCKTKLLLDVINGKEEILNTHNANNMNILRKNAHMRGELKTALQQQDEVEKDFNEVVQKVVALKTSLHKSEKDKKDMIGELLKSSVNLTGKFANYGDSEAKLLIAGDTSSYFTKLTQELQTNLSDLQTSYSNYTSGSTAALSGLVEKIILVGHLLSITQIQGITLCNISPDIEAGEAVSKRLTSVGEDILSMLQGFFEMSEPNAVNEKINILKDRLNTITITLLDLLKKSGSNQRLGDLVELELQGMDKAIEEAASKIMELLSNSRALDSGIALEVNERILDACTKLMESVRVLVQKSKILQAEIVATGKGTASAKEFYKRNNQWSEGLISASKSVAAGANLLVTAANKAVSGDVKHHLDIIVAAQEIAACTAQLVVASRVKAPKNSKHLSELSMASRTVTHNTATLVATAKNCNQQLEDVNDLSLTNLSVHQAKTLEMEMQVKVLELEQALESERMKLATFRKKNYRSE